MQIRGAFNDVARSLSWFIMAYDDLMRLAAAYERLQRLEQGLTDADETHCSLAAARIASDVPLAADMTLSVPFGDKIRTVGVDLKLSPGTITLVTGPSGIGKSTLLQVLAGFRGGFQGDIASRGRIFLAPSTNLSSEGDAQGGAHVSDGPRRCARRFCSAAARRCWTGASCWKA